MSNSKRLQPIKRRILTLPQILVFFAILSFAISSPAQSFGTWSGTGTLNFPRVGHTATLLANGQVLIAGGEDSQGNRIAAAELWRHFPGNTPVEWLLDKITAPTLQAAHEVRFFSYVTSRSNCELGSHPVGMVSKAPLSLQRRKQFL